MTDKPSREDVVRVARECGICIAITGGNPSKEAVERFAAAMYAAGADAEREVSDKLEKALTAMVQANGGVNVMPGQQAREQNSALNNSRAALTEVAAIRATHTNREQS